MFEKAFIYKGHAMLSSCIFGDTLLVRYVDEKLNRIKELYRKFIFNKDKGVKQMDIERHCFIKYIDARLLRRGNRKNVKI